MPKMISCEDFDQIKEINVKLNILFGYTKDIYEGQTKKEKFCQDQKDDCGKRFKSLENRKTFDTTFSGLMGIVGGGIVWLGKTILGK